jgi:two-component system nitrogen regulation sensor histidine kinase GlnL
VTAYHGLDLLSTAVLLLDENLTVTYANPAAETLFAQGRNHLVGNAFGKALPGNDEFAERLRQAVGSDAGFNDNDLLLEVEGYPAHLHCVMSPVEAPSGTRLVLEFRPLEQLLKIAREAKILEQQAANRELIRNLAHEIKNPLGGIRGAAQLLERELGDPEQREFTQVIVKEADRLQSLMNRLLTPNRLPRVEPLNVHEVMERVRTLLLAEFPALAMRRDYDTSLPDLVGDKEQLIQAILNVARNAAQATEGAGEIRLITRIARQVTIARIRHRHAVAISIEDDGPGVPPQLAERIFYPLVSGRDGGTGLGLSLAQSFVSQHQGLIEFQSAPGRTRFTILLPVPERTQ